VKKFFLAAKGPATNAEPARLMGCSEGTASKRVSKAVQAGVVTRERRGREVAVYLN
jgi:DNA-binding Lrp family transcriptional regulator